MGRDSNWTGWVAFAGVLIVIRGILEGIAGLTALLKDTYYLVGEESLLVFDYTTWGWLHLLGGFFLIWVGMALLNGANWARLVAIALVSLALIGNLLFIASYPFWSIFAIVIDVIVIYALTAKGGEETA